MDTLKKGLCFYKLLTLKDIIHDKCRDVKPGQFKPRGVGLQEVTLISKAVNNI